MTQKEKARAYDNALKIAKEEMSKDGIKNNVIVCGVMKKVFPELAMSEDEKIRKALINVFAIHKDYEMFWGVSVEDILAWLEKQGEQKPNPYSGTSFEYNGHAWGMCARDNGVDILCDKRIIEHFEMQGEQKPVDKIESKFKEGDWVVNNESGGAYQVTEIRDDEYCLWPLNGKIMGYLRIIDVDNDYHLWTIQDAKDGDVLYSLDSNQPFIYKERNRYAQATAYCGLNIFGRFFVWDTKDCVITLNNSNCIPATKKQRDTLMKAMADAGYTFDFESKELKQTHVGMPELKESENERIKNELIGFIKKRDRSGCDYDYDKWIAWLEEQGKKDKLIQELGEYKVKYTQEVLEKHINSLSNTDDERLRKTTIAFLKNFAEQGYENAVECIDWLEKQGEKPQGKSAVEAIKEEKVDNANKI